MVDTIINSFDIWTNAQGIKSRTRIKSVDNISLEGIARLRDLILDLAVRGQLVPHDTNDEHASKFLERIIEEKTILLKQKNIKGSKILSNIKDEEKPFDLPKSWVFTRNKDIFHLKKGKKPKNLSEVKNKFPYLDIEALDRNNILRYTDDDNCPMSTTEDILVVCDGSRSGLVLEGQNGVIGSTLSLIVTPKIIQFYIKLIFKQAFQRLNSSMKGAAIPHLDTRSLLTDVIGFPPLEEQKRIVAKVDELMALCDILEKDQSNNLKTHEVLVKTILETLTQAKDTNELQEAWERMSTHFDTLFCTEDSIEQLKQTILQLGVMGKLVKQEPNDEPASGLLKRIAAEKAKLIKEGKIKRQKPLPEITEYEQPFQLPESWEWVKFDYIAENCKSALKAGPFGSSLKKSMYVEKGYKIYGQEQVISGDENLGDYYINQEKFDTLESCSIKPGDILISLVGTIGKVLVLSEECQPGIINPRLVKLSLFEEVNRNYIRHMLAAPFVQNELDEKSHGGTMNILNLGLLRSLVFPLPPVSEQLRIVNKVENLFSICELLKNRIKNAQTIKGLLSKNIVEKIVQ